MASLLISDQFCATSCHPRKARLSAWGPQTVSVAGCLPDGQRIRKGIL